MAEYPALDVPCDELDSPLSDRVYALLDDFEPIGIQTVDGGLRVFFRSTAMRDNAQRAIVQGKSQPVDRRIAAQPVEVRRDGEEHGARRDSSCR